MVRTPRVIAGLVRNHQRALRERGRISGNNLVLATIILGATQPPAAAFLLLAVAIPLIASLASEPCDLPRVRLLPLPPAMERLVRIVPLVADPLLLVPLAGGLFLGRRALPWAGLLIAALLGIRWLSAWIRNHRGTFRRPKLPGRFPGLLAAFLLEPLRLLDTWAAVIVSLAGLEYRIHAESPNAFALTAASLLVVLCLSTSAQRPFAQEGPEGYARLRLMPLRAWQILLLKDAAFLAILLPLVAPLSLPAGVGAGLAVLSVGQFASPKHPEVDQAAWQFSHGHPVPLGLVQIAALAITGAAIHHGVPGTWPSLLVIWIASLAWASKRMDG